MNNLPNNAPNNAIPVIPYRPKQKPAPPKWWEWVVLVGVLFGYAVLLGRIL